MTQPRTIPAWQQAILDKSGRPGAEWSKIDKEAMLRQPISALFEEQVARSPQRLAVKTTSVQLSYAELNRAANRVVRSILAEQQESTAPVALCFSERSNLVVGILGVLKAGRFFVILDQHASPEQNSRIITDLQTDLLYTDVDSLNFDQASSVGFPRICRIDQLDPSLADKNLSATPSAHPIARLVYTSGSTGRPKGVIQSQQQIVHALINYHTLVRFTPDDSLLYNSTTGFSNALVPLLCGASLFPIDLRTEGISVLAERIRQDKVTVFHIVPTVLQHFVSTLRPDETFPAPRVISLMGEPVSRKQINLFRLHFPQTIFINLLGSKESLDYRAFALDAETLVTGDTLPAGYALEDTDILLVDPTGKPVAEQGIGEIVVKSRYLSPGYWNNPELTARKFREDPSSSGKRVYFTGDLGRFLPDGCLVTVGRNDFQVKIRGYQVRLDEVETALAQIDGVVECAIVLNDEPLDHFSLDAYVVAKQPGITLSALRAALAKKLPEYMLPARFVYLDALPYTPMGKVDRTALKSMAPSRPLSDAPFAQASTPIEHTVAAFWADVLGLDAIGIHDPFLELGGHSLQAMRIAARVNEEFGVEIPLAEMFAASTVAEMALAVTAALASEADVNPFEQNENGSIR